MSPAKSVAVLSLIAFLSLFHKPATADATLVAALDGYEKAIVDKLNSDLETIASSFADARDIQRARRLADWAKPLLDIIGAALDLPSFIRDFRSIIAGIEKAENQLELTSKLFLLYSISKSAGGFKLAISHGLSAG